MGIERSLETLLELSIERELFAQRPPPNPILDPAIILDSEYNQILDASGSPILEALILT